MPKKYGMMLGGEDFVEVCGKVQRGVYKLNPAGPEYIKEMAFAAVVEICEMVNELDWKGTRDGVKGKKVKIKPGDGVTEKSKVELVDAMIFLGNIGAAMGMTSVELWDAMNRKVAVNVQRRQKLGKE